MDDKNKKGLNDVKDLVSVKETESSLVPIIETRDLVAVPSDHQHALKAYLKEINRFPLLSIEQEKALTKSFQESGDIKIAKKLVLHNLRLVVKIAMEYKSSWQNIMDLIQEGNIGLMKAVSKYDPEKGAKLSYYASWWIKSYILKFILDNFRLVKLGTTNEQKKLFYNLMKEKSRLEAQGIQPDAKLISENLGVSEKAVVSMDKRMSGGHGELSLDAQIPGDGSISFLEMMSSEEDTPEEEVSDKLSKDLLKEHLTDFIEGLKERDRDIFKKRLLEEIPPSLQEIADDYGISRERVRQIEERLLNKLKLYMSEFIR